MATLADIRRTALALPGAEEVIWYGAPGFNVGKKTFVCLWGKDGRWIFKLPDALQLIMFEVRPDVFAPYRAGAMRWSYVDIAALTKAEAKRFVTEAWATVVAKKISRDLLAEVRR